MTQIWRSQKLGHKSGWGHQEAAPALRTCSGPLFLALICRWADTRKGGRRKYYNPGHLGGRRRESSHQGGGLWLTCERARGQPGKDLSFDMRRNRFQFSFLIRWLVTWGKYWICASDSHLWNWGFETCLEKLSWEPKNTHRWQPCACRIESVH